ncbi:MAG: DUF4136 domain-containing protein [Desulforhopalus sp.]|nr:DUF4136 domain-containing protein [Desulforhopalus sp.]
MKKKLFIFPNHFVLLKVLLILLWLVALVSSCTSVQVSQDYDTSFAFEAGNTFGWNEKLQHENDNPPEGDELLAKRFKGAVEKVLTSQGFRQDTRPVLLVSYIYEITSKLQVNPFNSHFGYGFSRYGYYRGVGIDTASSIRQYDQGKLVISIHSARTGQLLWKGTGTREVFMHSRPDQITRSVNEMVEAVLAQFPPLNY